MNYIKPIILPLVLSVIPALYHYSNNVEKLTAVSLYRMLALNVVIAIVIYVIALVFTRFLAFQAANAAFVFLIFFNIYGLIYRYLLNLDLILIKHYTFLPVVIFLAIYVMMFIIRLNDSVTKSLWRNLVVVSSVLVFFNLFSIVPAEWQRWRSNVIQSSQDEQYIVSSGKKTPDIYYIIMDEFEGFQGMRDYWNYQGVDEFAGFLKDKGFFVAEASHGSSTDTLHQMASRLNYREYPLKKGTIQTHFKVIADNQVMHYLKSRGYTTVVFDETKMGYPSAKTIQADYVYEYGSPSIPQSETGTYGFYVDEFGELVMKNTMLSAALHKYRRNILNPGIDRHRNMILFTVRNIADPEISSPKFVYVHLMLPHAPFIFEQNGDIAEYEKFTDWNYYINNYIFSIKVARALVEKILLESDPENPPVIILQSDHGARNQPAQDDNSRILENYPEELKTLILYALYVPGYDYSSLPQDINPTNTFPIVFNYLFDANIPLLK